ncbi:hypothetical protein IEQ34_011423 [Dendrobium chrysotoxum]|uniref:Uncharacterized protein n=1 Tax=Dendrobium chrysotoxum TaxID=161865 RepID=A0AAV7G9Y8_DENCH|nr:hypothetical protein IEQ34_011423 [Dendrobium chrysotoxum]
MEETKKKMLEIHTKTASSEARGAAAGQGSGVNPNPIRKGEDQEVEILEREGRMPSLEFILREETSMGYGERREYVGYCFVSIPSDDRVRREDVLNSICAKNGRGRPKKTWLEIIKNNIFYYI